MLYTLLIFRLAACDKVAVVIGNAAYVHHRKLSSSVADVRILKTALSKAGFKVSIIILLSYM